MPETDSVTSMINMEKINQNNPPKTESQTPLASEDYRFLEPLVTSIEDDVYAFTDKASPVTAAAAMARLSRRGDDLRVILSDEFAQALEKRDENLLRRVITAYGDDSVQQLVGQHIVCERVSNLATKELEWGRLAAYLEQSTRYLNFADKHHGHYKYHIPLEVKEANMLQAYSNAMDTIFDNYRHCIEALTVYVREINPEPDNPKEKVAWRNATHAQACDAARNSLPTALQSTVGIFASGQAVENMVMRMLSKDLKETQALGRAILQAARANIGVFLERADRSNRGGAISAYHNAKNKDCRQLINQLVMPEERNDVSAEWGATLIDCNFEDELEIVPNIIFEYSNLSLSEIQQRCDKLSRSQKIAILNAYIGNRDNRRQRPGRALERIHYSWEIVCDYGIFRDLQRHRMVDDLDWQLLTPYLGYETPELITQADLEDIWHDTYQTSHDLYQTLDSKIGSEVAQYATLMGHLMRWKVTYNARQAFHLHELRTSSQGHPGYRHLVQEMHQTVSTIHPHLAAAMKFVDYSAGAQLTRAEAERQQQLKLERLQNSK